MELAKQTTLTFFSRIFNLTRHAATIPYTVESWSNTDIFIAIYSNMKVKTKYTPTFDTLNKPVQERQTGREGSVKNPPPTHATLTEKYFLFLCLLSKYSPVNLTAYTKSNSLFESIARPITDLSSEPEAMNLAQGLRATPTGWDLFTWPSYRRTHLLVRRSHNFIPSVIAAVKNRS